MEQLFSVKDNVAMITGASSGIGKHFALTLAKCGAHVILVGRNEQRLLAVEQACRKHPVQTLAITADVKDSKEVEKVLAISKKHFSKLDILINSAGIGVRKPLFEQTEQEWDDVIDINLKGTFLMSQAMSLWMLETKTPGRIINISSASAFHTTPVRIAYGASKIGVESITRSMALNLVKQNIRVNCISPGFIISELTEDYLQTENGKAELKVVPMQRAGTVEELEGALLFLASNASSYISGSVVHVDGGWATSKV